MTMATMIPVMIKKRSRDANVIRIIFNHLGNFLPFSPGVSEDVSSKGLTTLFNIEVFKEKGFLVSSGSGRAAFCGSMRVILSYKKY